MPENNLKRLGKRVKAARDNRRMTQQQVSDASGLAVRTVSKIERGLMNPSFEVLSTLVRVLGVSFDSLFVSADGADNVEIQELIGLYQSCPKSKRRVIMATTNVLVQELANTEQEPQ